MLAGLLCKSLSCFLGTKPPNGIKRDVFGHYRRLHQPRERSEERQRQCKQECIGGIEEAEEQTLLLAEPELPHQLAVSQGTNPKKRFYSASKLG